MTQKFLFVRHGETIGNLEQIAHGQTESPLNDRGVRQAEMTATMLRDWGTRYHRVYASPMSRAHHTGEQVAEALGIPLDTHDHLVEGFLGDWEGITYAELGANKFAQRSIADDDFRGHNGESPNQLADRMHAAFDEIRERHPDENIIFVSHGAAIAHLMARLMGTQPAFGYQYLMHNAAVSEVAFTGDGELPELSVLNFHEHLPEDLKISPVPRQHGADEKAFPESVEQLTPDWLEAALGAALDGARIVSFSPHVIGVGEGFMGQLARLSLELDAASDSAPTSVIVKFAAARDDTREMARDQNLYAREIGFYRDIGSSVGVRVPQCYFSRFDDASQRFVMLLEDMAPGVPSDQVLGTSRETSRWVVENLARVHAKWWNSPDVDTLEWGKWLINETPMEEGLARLRENTAQVEKDGSFDAYPEMKRLLPMLPPLFRIEPAPPFPFSLTHGDLRSDNIIEPGDAGGEYCVLDWQLCGKGDPVNDLTRWMVQSISVADRQATEQDLLKLYHETLIANGVTGFSYKALQNAFKTNLVVIYIMFSMSIETVDRSSERAQALFDKFYSRLDAALVDWEIEKLLKVLPLMVPFIKLSSWFKALVNR